MAITVKAAARGHHGGRIIEPGTVFLVEESALGSWMLPVDAADRDRLAGRLDDLSTLRASHRQSGAPPTAAMAPLPPRPVPSAPPAVAPVPVHKDDTKPPGGKLPARR